MTLTLLYDSLLQHFFTITVFQHFSTMLFSKFLYKNKQKLSSNSSLKSFPPTLLRYTSLQHTFPTHLYLCLLSNTSLQHPSPTLLSNTLPNKSPQHFFTTPFSKISLQHVCPTSLQWISPQQLNTTAAKHHARKTTKQYRRTQIIRKLSGFDNWLPATVSCIHNVQTCFNWPNNLGVAPTSPQHMRHRCRKSLPLKQPTPTFAGLDRDDAW